MKIGDLLIARDTDLCSDPLFRLILKIYSSEEGHNYIDMLGCDGKITCWWASDIEKLWSVLSDNYALTSI
jgi:hypothetical protein